MENGEWVMVEIMYCPACALEYPLTCTICPKCQGEVILKTVRVPVEDR